jgi:hypothetical protein
MRLSNRASQWLVEAWIDKCCDSSGKRFHNVLGLRCGRAVKNQSAGSSKVMRRRTEEMTRKGVKLYDIIWIRGSTLNKNTD